MGTDTLRKQVSLSSQIVHKSIYIHNLGFIYTFGGRGVYYAFVGCLLLAAGNALFSGTIFEAGFSSSLESSSESLDVEGAFAGTFTCSAFGFSSSEELSLLSEESSFSALA